MTRNWLLAAIAAGCMMLAPAGHAGINAWTFDAPEGDAIFWVAIHPSRPGTMFAQGLSDLYRTTDAGAHWTRIPAPAVTIDGIHFDPTDSDRIFLVVDTVYRSTDGGQTFVAAGRPEESGLFRLGITPDGTLFAGDAQARLYRSTDQGSQWQPVTVPWTHQPGFAGISTIAVDPNAPDTVYVGHEPSGLYRSVDGGATWDPLDGVSPGDAFSIGSIRSIGVQPGNPDRLLVGTSRYWFSSSNRGATWTQHTSSISGASWVGFDPSAPTNAVALTALGDVFRSTDFGDTWPAAPSARLKSLALHAAFAPSRAGRLLLASADGPMLSDDGGATFAIPATGIRGGRVGGFAASSDGTLYVGHDMGPAGVFRRGASGWTGVNNTALRAAVPLLLRVTSLAMSPANPDALFVVNNISEFFVSLDRGDTWSSPGFVDMNTVPRNIAVDPANAAVIYVTTQNDGVWKSIDGGANWTKHSQGIPDNTNAIGIDPADPDVVYVSTHDPVAAIYKSTDGGASWAPTGSFRDGWISGFTFHPVDTRIIYAYSGADVLMTTNGGQSWSTMNFGAEHGFNVRGQAVLIDPVHPTTMFVVGPHDGGGFFRSVDGGSFWELVPYAPLPGDVPFLDRAVLDPMRPNLLYVADSDHGIASFEVAPDLSVIIEGLENPVAADSEVDWLVTVRNEGPWSSSPAELRVTVPDWLETVDAPGCTIAGTQLTCAVPALRSGFPLFLTLRSATGQDPDTGDIVATVEGYESDPEPSNNVATFTVESTRQAPLEVEILPDAEALPHGEATSFLARITNTGPSRARDVRLELALPTYTVTGVAGSPQQCAHTDTTLSCAFGTLESNASVSLRVNVIVNEFGLNFMTGAATRTGDDPEATAPINSALRGLPVTDVQLQITESSDPVIERRPMTYVVRVTNAGPDPAQVTVNIDAPGLTLGNVGSIAGTCFMPTNEFSAICEIATLASGAQANIEIALTAPFAGEVAISATASFDGRDTAPANNDVMEITTISSAPPPQPPPTGGGGGSGRKGGGGGFDWLLLMALGALTWRSARRPATGSR